MGDWKFLAAAHIFVGFEVDVLGMLGSGGNDAAQACLILGMLCYLVTVILVILMQFGSLGGDKGAQIAAIVLIFVAALLVVVGAAIWGDGQNNFSGTSPYSMTLDVTASALATIGGVFLILDMSGGGGGKTGPN